MTGPAKRQPWQVFIYVQHLSGVGHMVRSQQIGLALAERHQVSILDGGRVIPFPPALKPVSVPALARCDGDLSPLDDALSLPRAFELRRERLHAMLCQQRPDVILVEHFPFSKWELAVEIDTLLDYARRTNPNIKIIASLRDISLRTTHEAGNEYEKRVLQLLQRHFDGLLVHADPTLCQLGDYFVASTDIKVPVFHTGIVAAEIESLDMKVRRQRIGSGEYLVASAGGGADRAQLLPRVVYAWRQLIAAGTINQHRLLLFSGLEGYPPSLREMIHSEPSIIPMGFDPDFKRWLQGAALSISCAGYNTCADLLTTRTPALLMANPAMSDQAERARLMIARGGAVNVPQANGDADPLASLIRDNLGRGKITHTIRLDGARQSALCIDRWCQASRASSW